LPIHDATAPWNLSAFEVPSPPLHDPPDPPVAELLVCAERALFHGTFEFTLESLDEPVDFQVNAGVD
jgi:hypothetical protein